MGRRNEIFCPLFVQIYQKYGLFFEIETFISRHMSYLFSFANVIIFYRFEAIKSKRA